MKHAITAAVAAAALALALTGCSHSPSAAACKTALKQQYATALATGKTQTEPAACKGLSAAVLRQLAGEVIAGQ